MSLSGASPCSTTSSSIARARPTASSSRACGERSPSSARTTAFTGRRRRYGPMTMARPVGEAVWLSRSVVSRRRDSKSGLLCRRLLGAFEQLDRVTRHDGRYGVLVDELGVPISSQQHAEIIEPGHDPLQLHAVHQEDRERRFTFSDVIEEGVLQILSAVGCHCRCSDFLFADPGSAILYCVLLRPRVTRPCGRGGPLDVTQR